MHIYFWTYLIGAYGPLRIRTGLFQVLSSFQRVDVYLLKGQKRQIMSFLIFFLHALQTIFTIDLLYAEVNNFF